MTTKVFLNRASWVILTLLLIPAGAVMASENAVPGDSMYSTKIVLEDALLLVMKPSNSATSDIEMKFTKRRLLEVEQVADTPFVIKNLKNLNEQVTDTTTSIGKVKNLDKQAEQVAEYIQTLQETQASLGQQQVAAANQANNPTNPNPTNPNPTNKVVNNYYYESNSYVDEAAQAELRIQFEATQVEIAAELERLRLVALENERLQQQHQAEAAALEAEKKRQAADKLEKKQQEAAQKAADEAQREQQQALEDQKRAEERAQQEAQQQLEVQQQQDALDSQQDDEENQHDRGNRGSNNRDDDDDND